MTDEKDDDWLTPEVVALLREEIALGAPHDCYEWAHEGACLLCDRDMRMCGRCYDEGVALFPANCAEQPERHVNVPLGMYHCPDCGAMVLAGMPHPSLCQRCLDRRHPGFDP